VAHKFAVSADDVGGIIAATITHSRRCRIGLVATVFTPVSKLIPVQSSNLGLCVGNSGSGMVCISSLDVSLSCPGQTPRKHSLSKVRQISAETKKIIRDFGAALKKLRENLFRFSGEIYGKSRYYCYDNG